MPPAADPPPRTPTTASPHDPPVAPGPAAPPGRAPAAVVSSPDGLRAAAFHGAPGAALDLLAGLDPDGPLPDRTRWLAGVCLGALGRYAAAARYLRPAGDACSPALSCRASHLRQVGRHAEAEPLDRLALRTALDAEATADALVGLVADAVGRLDLPTARQRLAAAAEVITAGDSGWRAPIRLDWVTAEVALLGDDPTAAVDCARRAIDQSLNAPASRHAVKSHLVLGVALDAAGRSRPAARVLRAAATGADRLGLTPLVSPSLTVRTRIMRARAPQTAARERQRADSAQSIIEDPAGGLRNR